MTPIIVSPILIGTICGALGFGWLLAASHWLELRRWRRRAESAEAFISASATIRAAERRTGRDLAGRPIAAPRGKPSVVGACGVRGCMNQRPHSHVMALAKRLREDRPK